MIAGTQREIEALQAQTAEFRGTLRMRPRRLTEEHCRCVKHSGKPGPDRHTVVQRGYGLALVVKPSGSKSFTQRLTVEGRRTDVGLGAFTFHNLIDVGTEMDEAARPLVLPSAPFRAVSALAPVAL